MSDAAKALEEMAEELDERAENECPDELGRRRDVYGLRVAACLLRARAAELRAADAPPGGGRWSCRWQVKPDEVRVGQTWRAPDGRVGPVVLLQDTERHGTLASLRGAGVGEVDSMLHDDRWEFIADENGVHVESSHPAPSGEAQS